MAIDFRKRDDQKLLLGATVAVLLAGGFIIGVLLMTTGGNNPVCGQLDVGLASSVRSDVERGPLFRSGGGNCGFWLALNNGDITAYRAVQPAADCTLDWKSDHWECGGRAAPVSELEQYPVTIQTQDGVDVVIVNLGSPQPSGATGSLVTS